MSLGIESFRIQRRVSVVLEIAHWQNSAYASRSLATFAALNSIITKTPSATRADAAGSDARGRGRRCQKGFPPAPPAVLDAEGARAASVRLEYVRRAARARRRELPGADAVSSSGSSAATARARAPCSSAWPGIYGVDAGRVDIRGRLSPFIELGVGFNPDLTARDNVLINAIMLGPEPQGGPSALRRDHRVRRARGVRGPEAEELLVGHERAARILGSDSGGRRGDPDRRGARRGRRRLPAQVLRPVRAHAGRGPHDPVRDARHGRRRALLRPRHAASRRGD